MRHSRGGALLGGSTRERGCGQRLLYKGLLTRNWINWIILWKQYWILVDFSMARGRGDDTATTATTGINVLHKSLRH